MVPYDNFFKLTYPWVVMSKMGFEIDDKTGLILKTKPKVGKSSYAPTLLDLQEINQAVKKTTKDLLLNTTK